MYGGIRILQQNDPLIIKSIISLGEPEELKTPYTLVHRGDRFKFCVNYKN